MATSIYIGLSEKARLCILAVAALIATCNLTAAWYFAFAMGENLKLTTQDMEPFSLWIKQAKASSASVEVFHDLAARAMHIVAMTKLIANKQGIVLACFGGAFALSAMGFALFIIGADGAFKISANSNEKAKLVFSSTAPGLLCFVLCTGLIGIGVRQQTSLNLPELLRVRSADTHAEDSCAWSVAGKCFSQAEWDKRSPPQGDQK